MTEINKGNEIIPPLSPRSWKDVLRFAPLIIGALAVITGGLVLVGWAMDIAVLKSISPSWVSMKPNTAIGFILTGLAMLLSFRSGTLNLKHSAFVVRFSRFCALLAGLIGLLSLIQYMTGSNFGIDQLMFFEPAGTVGTSHAGRMAPDTAICFALLAVGLEFARISRRRRRMINVTAIIGALVTTIALVEILSYFTPVLRTAGWGGLTMMALPTATLFAMLGAALLLMAWQIGQLGSSSAAMPSKGFGSRPGLGFLLVFLSLASGIIATGIYSYRSYERNYRIEAEKSLMAIAELKVGELEKWRKERIGDGKTLYKNPAFSELVRRFFEKPEDTEAQRLLKAWLNRIHASYMYKQIVLTDTSGRVRLSVPQGKAPIPHLAQHLAEALEADQVSFLDFHRHTSDGLVYLGVMVPVVDKQEDGPPLGLVTFSIDPETYLYPFINFWPSPSLTAETLLVRREEEEVVFLNPLRFQTNAALTLRRPLNQVSLPAVMVASGKEGIVEGLDYRGAQVLAALRIIPDSPWSLVARRDAREIFAPLRERLWLTVLLVSVLLMGTGAGISLIWRQQRLRFYREQAKSTEKLQESTSMLTRAEQLGNVGGWEFDLDTNKMTWSDMVYQIHELDRDVQLTMDQSISFYTPDSRPIIELAVQRAIEKGKPYDVELELITAKGNSRQVHAIGNADLEHHKISGFFQDITDRKEAEMAIMLEASFTSENLNPILRIAMDGTLLYANDGATKSLSGLNLQLNQSAPSVFRDFAVKALDSGVSQLFDFDQVENTFSFRAVPIGSDHVNLYGRDITERKLLEKEKAKFETQLLQSQRMEAVGQLAGGIAHDFNNMLAVINGYSEMLLLELDSSDPKYKRMNEIYKAGIRSADLTRQLLAFARKQVIAPKILDLNDTVTGMLKMLQRLIGENLKLEWKPAGKLWKVKMDPSQIDQIMTNLVINARDAISDVGKIVIKTGQEELDEAFCEIHPDLSPGKYVVLSVSDNGQGMDQKTMERIFEPFYTTKEVGKGTGLGLATVFGIVKQNNGGIDVSSEPGKGATFKIYLPIDESVIDEKDKKSTVPKLLTGTETVLLVEDETSILEFARELLEQLGYTVLAADNPLEAIKIAEEYKTEIHIIVTDVIMPEMSGPALRDKISSFRPDIRCMFISGYSADHLSKDGTIDEDIHFLQKPFTAQELSVKLREVLALH